MLHQNLSHGRVPRYKPKKKRNRQTHGHTLTDRQRKIKFEGPSIMDDLAIKRLFTDQRRLQLVFSVVLASLLNMQKKKNSTRKMEITCRYENGTGISLLCGQLVNYFFFQDL